MFKLGDLAASNRARESASSWRRWLKPAMGLAITGVFTILVLKTLPLKELPQNLASLSWSYLTLGLLCLILGYATRIVRWWWMLRATAQTLKCSEVAAPFLISIAANNVLPFRAGDILRLFAFRGRHGAEPSRVGGTLIVERLLDLLVLIFLFVIVLPYVPSGDQAALSSLSIGAAALGVIGLAALMSMPIFQRYVLPPLRRKDWIIRSAAALKLIDALSSLVDTILTQGTIRRLSILMVLSAMAWLFEGGVFLATAMAVGIAGGWQVAYLALAIATLSTLIPSSPGYVGTFHFFAMQATIFFGNPEPKAAVFALIVHLMLWLPTTIAGAVAFAFMSLVPRKCPHGQPNK